jgi:hypothetical protein
MLWHRQILDFFTETRGTMHNRLKSTHLKTFCLKPNYHLHCSAITSGPNVVKLFTFVIYECSQLISVFVLGRPFQLTLMFVGKVKSAPWIGTPKRSSTQVGSSLTHKHQTRYERPAKEKRYSLLEIFVNYVRKRCITLSPRPNVLKFFTSAIYKCL